MTVRAERSRFFGPDGAYLIPRQRRAREQPQLGLLLPADHRHEDRSRSCSTGRRRDGPKRRDPRRRCAATSRATTATCATPASTTSPTRVPRQAVGQADRGDRRLPPLLPARAAGQPGRRDRRHRGRAAAGAAVDARSAERAAQRTRSAGELEGPAAARGDRLQRRRPRQRGRPTTAAAWCSATRTSRGTAPSASTSPTSRSRARSNVAGASLFGVPVILIGHTQNLAWSHTVSTAYRFTPVRGEARPRLADDLPRRRAAARDEARPRDRHGRWATAGSSSRDAHALLDRPRARSSRRSSGCRCSRGRRSIGLRDGRRQRAQLPLPQPLLRDEPGAVRRRARRDLRAATRASRGSTRSPPTRRARPTTPTSRSCPNVPNAKSHALRQRPLGIGDRQRCCGLPVLDGSRAACDWGTDPDAVQPGIFGPSHMPSLFRDDYVTNSNDSYWLTNPEQPLEGFARIIGDERTARALRTRLGLRMVAGAPRRPRRAAGQALHARPAAGRGLQQPPVRRRAVARRARRDVPAEPD